MLRARERGVLAGLLSLVLTLLPNSAALASHQDNCSEYGFVNHQNGYISDSWSNHRYGIRAQFQAEGLALCLNPRAGEGSASTGWVAIQGPPVPIGVDYGNIVQFGHGACRPIAGGGCNSAMQDGYAYGRWSGSAGCSGYTNKAPTGVWLGGWSNGGTYSVNEEADHDFQLSSPSFGVTIQNAAICWTNQYVTVFAETHDYGDALGGSSTNTHDFTAKNFRTTPGGTWLVLPNACNARGNAADPPFKCSAQNGALKIWTDR